MVEQRLQVGASALAVRDAGDPDGFPVVYFHGTPGCRLDMSHAEAGAEKMGVRLVSFDRPGYGGSPPGPYGIRRIAEHAGGIADQLGIDRFATMGWSGGGPFALATAAVLGARVSRVGVASGPGPFDEVPGARATLSAADLDALTFLPHEPARAVEAFTAGSEGMLAVRDDEEAMLFGLTQVFGETDGDVLSAPDMRHHLFVMMREGLAQGFMGVAWDNVSFIGPWGVDLTDVACPVLLWYGERDQMMPLAHGRWLSRHLADADLEVYPGEGHLLPMRHWRDMLTALATPGTTPHGTFVTEPGTCESTS